MRIDKNGLNPTIPLCYYCGKEKNQIVLTGAEGSKWARKNRRWLITEDYIKRIINNEELLSSILEKRVAFIDETTAKKLGF